MSKSVDVNSATVCSSRSSMVKLSSGTWRALNLKSSQSLWTNTWSRGRWRLAVGVRKQHTASDIAHPALDPGGSLMESENSETPKSSIFTDGFSINHPFWPTPILGNPNIIPTMSPLKPMVTWDFRYGFPPSSARQSPPRPELLRKVSCCNGDGQGALETGNNGFLIQNMYVC